MGITEGCCISSTFYNKTENKQKIFQLINELNMTQIDEFLEMTAFVVLDLI